MVVSTFFHVEKNGAWPGLTFSTSGLLAAEKQQVARALMEVHFSKNEVPGGDEWKVDTFDKRVLVLALVVT